MPTAHLKANRPLSPHLTIYRWPLTMAMSIAHRVTGVGLYIGSALLVIWLLAAASGPEAYAAVNGLYGSWFGLVCVFIYSFVLLHHALGGVRHFIWDAGRGLTKPARDLLALANIVGSLALTVLLWAVILVAR